MEDAGECIMDMNFLLRRLAILYYFLIRLFWATLCGLRYPLYPPQRMQKLREAMSRGPISHRGGIPENTLEGFQYSRTVGASVVEVDLSFTKDGHPVLFHDPVVDRTSNGSGWLHEMTLKEAKTLDVGVKFGVSGARIPTLEEAVAMIKQLGLFMLLDVKGTPEETVLTLETLFSSDNTLYDKIAVVSFYPDVIYALRQKDPNILCGVACCSTEFSHYPNKTPRFSQCWKQTIATVGSRLFYWILVNWVCKVLHIAVLLPNKHDIINNRFSAKNFMTNYGTAVAVWTVNTPAEQQYFKNDLQIPFMTDTVTSDMYN